MCYTYTVLNIVESLSVRELCKNSRGRKRLMVGHGLADMDANERALARVGADETTLW